jgi:hypothetical protein
VCVCVCVCVSLSVQVSVSQSASFLILRWGEAVCRRSRDLSSAGLIALFLCSVAPDADVLRVLKRGPYVYKVKRLRAKTKKENVESRISFNLRKRNEVEITPLNTFNGDPALASKPLETSQRFNKLRD